MSKFKKILFFSKRQKLVGSVVLLSFSLFLSEYLSGLPLLVSALILSVSTAILLYASIKNDVKETFFYPILILPLFYTASFSLFYPLIPARLFTRLILTSIYALGLYSLFLTQNIFAVSTIRTITLLRSARIVSFIITIVTLFLLTNVIFSLRLPVYLSSTIILATTFFLNFQSLWIYSLEKKFVPEALFLSVFIALSLAELSLILTMWPINASIYSIFLTGIFYAYSGLTRAWIEKRLFRGVFWEYIWVGFLSVLILIFFSRWGF